MSLGPSQGARRSSDALQKVVEDLKVLRYDVLFPVGHWVQGRPWELRSVQVLLFFTLFPLALYLLFQGHRNLDQVVWALGLYFSVVWAAVLYRIVSPERVETDHMLLTGAFTAVAGVGLLLIAIRIPPLGLLYQVAPASPVPLVQVAGWVLGVGLLEEATKMLPVLWTAFRLRRVSTPREAAFLGGISGLGFGIAEAVRYSSAYAFRNFLLVLPYPDYLMLQTLRLISLPFLHCVWSSIAGYYVGLGVLWKDKAAALAVMGLAAASVLHGLYDLFAHNLLSLAVAAIAVLVFVSYARSAEEIASSLMDGGPASEQSSSDSTPQLLSGSDQKAQQEHREAAN